MNAAIRRSVLLPFCLLVAATAACAPLQPRDASGRTTVEPEAPPLQRAEGLLEAGRFLEAEEALAYVDVGSLDARGVVRLRLVRAELSLASGQPLFALQDLPEPGSTPDRPLAARTEAVRAEVMLSMRDIASAVSALVTRGRLLDDPVARLNNDDRIWRLLINEPLDANAQARFTGADRVTRGWFELALIARGAAPGRRETQLSQWRSRYPDHPGSATQVENAVIERADSGFLKTEPLGAIAVLLPEHGGMAAIGTAIRDGLVEAWQSRPEPRPPLRFYDTGSDPNQIARVIDQAVRDGATLILGPLRRPWVNAIGQMGALPVPVISLNQMDPGVLGPRNLYQFGIAPEDEARAAVRRIASEAHGRLVAVLMRADWSERIVEALDTAAQRGNGSLLATEYIDEGADFSPPIKAVLNVDHSEERFRALARTLGMQPEFTPRARGDADAAFIMARQRDAQQIAPRFAYFGAGDLPLYVSALAWDGQTPVPQEIRGLRICDMPWMMQVEEADWLALRTRLRDNDPERFDRFPRLYALGHDAMQLALRIQQGWATGEAFPGATGFLQLTDEGRIARELGCATLKSGGAEPLPPLVSREFQRRATGATRALDEDDDAGQERFSDDSPFELPRNDIRRSDGYRQ